jgi:hypothetical protein
MSAKTVGQRRRNVGRASKSWIIQSPPKSVAFGSSSSPGRPTREAA